MTSTETILGLQGNPFGSPDTPELAAPARQADAHRCNVTGVTVRRFEAGGSQLVVGLNSLDMGIDLTHNIWLPEMFADDPQVDPTTLPTSENFAEDQRGKYASAIHNSKNTATLDRYLVYANNQGRTDYSALRSATTIEEVAEALTALLSGIELIAVRRPQKNNPDFLEVKGTNSIEDAGNAKFITRLTKGNVSVRWLG